MPYYFISSSPEQFVQFIEQFHYLENGTWIKEKKDLEVELGKQIPGRIFIVQWSAHLSDVDDLVQTIRLHAPDSKVIYVIPKMSIQDLKRHQNSSVGGDAYIPFNINTNALREMIESFSTAKLNPRGSRLEETSALSVVADFNSEALEKVTNHPVSVAMDQIFITILKSNEKKPMLQSTKSFKLPPVPMDTLGDDMSDKDQELSLDDLGDLELGEESDMPAEVSSDDGMELSLDDMGDLDLGDSNDLSLSSDEAGNSSAAEELDLGDLNLDLGDSAEIDHPLEVPPTPINDDDLSLDFAQSGDLSLEDLDLGEASKGLNPSEPQTAEAASLDVDDMNLDFADDHDLNLSGDFSDEAKEKLKEIDEIMDLDASNIAISSELSAQSHNEGSIDEPLVSDDINLDSLNFSTEDDVEVKALAKEDKPKRKKKEEKETRDFSQDLQEISGAYSGEMERMQATISNLRADREELLTKIQRLEDDRVMQNRSTLSLRAELDEKKIELSIIRKKLNDEINDLKDRLKLFDEKKLILEERNRLLMIELDKASQKNKIDIKKVQMRERELEQRLELLKADAETQIRNRDLKILELKRKVDAMEFDMESISQQEKRSVESRFELEDKLDKAIKTLRSAINVLENESDRGNALDALKKNLDV